MKKKERSNFIGDLKRDFPPKTVALDLLCYVVGGFCYAAAVNIFNSPNSIAQGGATGKDYDCIAFGVLCSGRCFFL